MLSRGTKTGGRFGLLKPVCGVERARPLDARVIALRQQNLVGPHLGEIKPSMCGVVANRIDLAAVARAPNRPRQSEGYRLRRSRWVPRSAASHTASGLSSTGPTMGRHRLTKATCRSPNRSVQPASRSPSCVLGPIAPYSRCVPDRPAPAHPVHHGRRARRCGHCGRDNHGGRACETTHHGALRGSNARALPLHRRSHRTPIDANVARTLFVEPQAIGYRTCIANRHRVLDGQRPHGCQTAARRIDAHLHRTVNGSEIAHRCADCGKCVPHETWRDDCVAGMASGLEEELSRMDRY